LESWEASALFHPLPWKHLARDTQNVAALVNIGLQLIFGLLAVWFGNILAHAIGG
jgi:fluoride ion exporter CrcB/FEX